MTPDAAPRRSMRLQAAAILLLAAALYLPSVWNRDLWAPDEPRYAEATREMTVRGDFILPHLNGDVYSEKPPLFFWLSLIAGWIPGIPAGSGGRLVTVIASAATLILTWRMGAILADEITGWLAALVLATSLVFCQLAQSGVIDPLLTTCCTAALYGYVRHRGGARWGMAIFYAACSAGVLAKGPVALLIPALAAMTHALIEDGPRGVKALHPLWGLPLVAAPVALWLAAATARGGVEYAETMLVKQNLGRAVNAFVHKEPLHFFVLALPVAFLPWTLFLPQALYTSVRERAGRMRPMLFPLAWFASGFILFSLISGKKTRYMLPLFPAAALLVADWMTRRMLPEGKLARGRGALIAACSGGALLAAGLILPAIGGERLLPGFLLSPLMEPGSEAALAAVRSWLAPPAILLIVPSALFGLACLWSARAAWSARSGSLPVFLAGWAILLAAAGALWAPAINPIKSARYLADEIRSAAPGASLHYLRSNHSGALNFYLGVERIPLLRRSEEVRSAMRRREARFIATREEFERLERVAGIAFDLQLCRRVGQDLICLAAPRAAGPSPPA